VATGDRQREIYGLGEDRFSSQMQHPEVPDSKVLVPDLQAIMERVCEIYRVKRDELLRARREDLMKPEMWRSI